ncbi:hypothetical protein DUI87_31775 [Hirundo rustica rustica]|uniref:F-BAR domain-containing protein n=1 Tax=Hirundo rustica rustica TaxID=333673 RepID=A0A3M0ISK0_HIRRU|nr:hypothetical protein DUI87_31775 [Hirundo rustica rustica]
MGFGGDLKYSHDALLKLQDWELRLLETVKKFMVMRVKSDKEYASTLQNLCNQVDKESSCQLDYISNVSKSWLLMVQQTEQLSKIMKTHAEDLNSGPLHRLTMMIKDKQQVKKSFVGVHQQIEAEMYKVSFPEAFAQYIDADLIKGKETEKAKDRCEKATMKLHVLHNQYVLALKGAQLHQHQYYDTTLPLLLDSLQKMQEEMIKALKGILDEYSEITSLVTEEIVNVHRDIQTSVEQIDPNSEYNDFIDTHRSSEVVEQEIEFDTSLLEENENLQANEIMWNNLTAESLQVMLKTVIEELMQTQQTLLSKEKLVLELEKKIEESSKTCEKKSDIVLLLSQKQALEELKQTVQQLRCSEAKLAAQKELLEQKVQENDGKEPPPVVNYEEDARSVTSMPHMACGKSHGEWRLTVDYCALNKVTPTLSTAVPDMLELQYELASKAAKWYATIDIANAFFSIPLAAESRPQFAFTWRDMQYTWNRLPQEWKHSPHHLPWTDPGCTGKG